MYTRRLSFLCLVAFPVLMASQRSHACTSFAFRDSLMIAAKNYDWDIGMGMVVVNQRGVEKSFSIAPDPEAPTWTSRYGSVTFTQYGRDLPHGGMNEAGLVVEVLWLEGSEYPPDDERVDANCAQWIQYVLDTAATAEEVVASLGRVQVLSQIPLHCFVADQHGRTASVEFLARREVLSTGETMPAPVLTNTPYEDALTYLRGRGAGLVGEDPNPIGSRNRFVRAATMIERAKNHSQDPVSYAFDILSAVASPSHTQWSIVYDQRNLTIYFRTRTVLDRRTISLDTLEFTCGPPVMVADIDAELRDGTVVWRPYTLAANLDLIRRAYGATPFLVGVPDSVRIMVAGYPDRSRCLP